MRLIKAEATGNDFILVDLLDGDYFDHDRADWTRRVCDRRRGVGADGVVFLQPAVDVDVRWDFYNSDGGVAEMCGNATRAVGLYFQHRTARADLTIGTLVGPVRVMVHHPARIETTLAPLAELRREADYTFVRAGVPHAVVRVPDARDFPALRARALAIKARPEFLAEGVNVTFYRAPGGAVIDAVTFERGVEDFTLSCGTGAVAAAFAVVGDAASADAVQVRVPGGDLTVLCRRDHPILTGPARLIARFDWLAQGD